ncbi:uncharacterized protein LOC132306068 [Cornus florida]|uniref:uncharacterized protein LOC132306068 n=1 Tax=Cornus florida TaxID=4283 RepID=UPI0028A0E535|nr:uncharacterized protein LOC132306068 [Cornus florida]XP_059659251.1 uncharacterized protein LOC132306068 [Cornus florida]
MDKELMHMTYRVNPKYLKGAWRFADLAQANAGHPKKILCLLQSTNTLTSCEICENYSGLIITSSLGVEESEFLLFQSTTKLLPWILYRRFCSYFLGFCTVDFAAPSLDFVQRGGFLTSAD